MTGMKKCLLIMPLNFYSMASQMQAALQKCGFETTLCNDRYPDNLLTKVLWKAGVTKILYRATFKHVKRHFLHDGAKYDICIIIKGYGMSKRLIDEIRKCCSYIVGYNFDSFAFHPLSLSWYNHVDKFYTFDYADAQKYNLDVVELYSAISGINVLTNKNRKYDISVIQKIHSDRLPYISDVLSTLRPSQAFVYLYESNVVTMVLNVIKHPVEYLKLHRFLHFRTLAYKDYVEILSNSAVTLDFAHPKQSGITMRCFEAESCGCKIITNNSETIKRFNPNSVLVFRGKNDSAETFVTNYKRLLNSQTEMKQRTIMDFVNDLIKP